MVSACFLIDLDGDDREPAILVDTVRQSHSGCERLEVGRDSVGIYLVRFAANLGTIPPNTGLLTVRDGDDIYQVRFSADLQKNASVIFRRKK